MILPDKRLHLLLGLLLILAVIASLWPVWLSLWWLLVLIAMSLTIGDALLLLSPARISIARKLDTTLPLGRWQTVSLELQQQGYRPLHLRVFDHVPDSMKFDQLPLSMRLPPDRKQTLCYRIRPQRRGNFRFPKVQLHIRSPLHLWRRNHYCTIQSNCKVYPDFTGIPNHGLPAAVNRLGLPGLRNQQRRGDGQDFHQLRDYRHGDTMRQINWKTTSRLRKLISREYQEERNQQIIFLLDCSHRMASRDGELSHFDHSLDAIMRLAHIAGRQGDEVGITTFGGPGWSIPPAHGQQGFNRILEAVYDLQPGIAAPDYHHAAIQLLQRQKKRALVILLTSIQDQDNDELQQAVTLLDHKHLVVVASLLETPLHQGLDEPVTGFDQALYRAALNQFLLERQKSFDSLASRCTMLIDTPPAQLGTALVNSYFQIKRSGSL